MDRTDVITLLIAVVTVVVTAKPVQSAPFWLIVVLTGVSYPGGRKLLSATGPGSTWASYVFTASTGLAFAVLGSLVVRGFKSLRGTRAERRDHGLETDA
jgi:energy-coupling factor transporter transmembrane protein EcfT